jgi:ABC-type cobalamin/Fe3+-siderophores transport system ATPase subunit
VVSWLEARALSYEYDGPIRALDSVDLALEPGELVVAIGPNGSGKSTLLRCLGGLLAPRSGSALWEGRALGELSVRERALRIASVPQFLPALPDVRVSDFVLGGRYAHFGRWGRASRADHGAVAEALAQCDAADLGERLMNQVSGGQRQRVLVARAVAQAAKVLLIDEPTNSLDPEHQLRVFELIARLCDGGRAALVVTHDLNLASQFAKRLVLLERGRVAARGSVEEVLRPEVLGGVYGPDLFFGRFAGDGPGTGRPFVLPRWRGR